eukprot:6449674-Prymnesium_polylepis.1
MPPVSGLKPGTHTREALQAKAAAKAAHKIQLKIAVDFVAEGAGGPDAVAKMVEGCTVDQVKYAIKKAKLKKPVRAAWSILTDIEMQRL